MKKVQITSITLLFIFMINNIFAQINPISDSEKGATEQTKRLPLKRGEIVSLELVESISSDNIQKGDVVKLKVTNPVIVNGYTMINRGAYAEAIVRDVQRAKGYGRAGRIVLEAVNVETYDKQRIALKANGLLIVEGRERRGFALSVTTLSIVVGAVIGVATLGATGIMVGLPCAVVGALIHGREAYIDAGKMMSATIMETKDIETDPKLTTGH